MVQQQNPDGQAADFGVFSAGAPPRIHQARDGQLFDNMLPV